MEELPLFGRRPIGALARREKRGEGRFSEEYVFSIMDSLAIITSRQTPSQPFLPFYPFLPVDAFTSDST